MRSSTRYVSVADDSAAPICPLRHPQCVFLVGRQVKAKPSRHAKTAPVLKSFTDAELNAARALVASEAAVVKGEWTKQYGAAALEAAALTSVWQSVVDSHVYVPSLKSFAATASLSSSQVRAVRLHACAL